MLIVTIILVVVLALALLPLSTKLFNWLNGNNEKQLLRRAPELENIEKDRRMIVWRNCVVKAMTSWPEILVSFGMVIIFFVIEDALEPEIESSMIRFIIIMAVEYGVVAVFQPVINEKARKYILLEINKPLNTEEP